MTSKITRADCEELIKKVNPQNDCNVIEFNLEPFCKEIRGYLGEHFLLTIKTKNGQGIEEFTFFVKHVTTGGLLQSFEDIGFFNKEVFAYEFFDKAKTLVPELDVSVVPKVYMVKDDLMVFENLVAQGYKGPEATKLNHLEVFKILETLAKFHTISIAYEHRKSKVLNKSYKIPDDHDAKLLHKLFTKYPSSGRNLIQSAQKSCYTLIDILYPEEQREQIRQKLDKYVEEFFEIFNDTSYDCQVLSHADLWAFNLMMSYENGVPSHCKLVDFQLLRYSPPAHDVTMMIYCVTTEETRRKYIQQFYDHYYHHLKEELTLLGININDVLPLHEYQKTLKLFMKVAKYIWLHMRQIGAANAEATKCLFDDGELQKAVLCGHKRPEFVRQNYASDPVYRETNKENWLILAKGLDDISVSLEDIYEIIPQDILSKDFEVISYHAKKLCPLSMASVIDQELSIEIKHKNELKTFNYFVKGIFMNFEFHKFTTANNFMSKELDFYGKVVHDFVEVGISEIEEVIPKIYLNQYFLVVMEDIKSSGYKAQPKKSFNIDQIKLVLNGLAKLHASGYIFEEIMTKKAGSTVRLNKIYKQILSATDSNENSKSKNLMIAAKQEIKKAIELYGLDFKDFDQYKLQSKRCEISKNVRMTLCHGNLRSEKIMLSSHNVKLIDFKSYIYCPPTRDVALFLTFNLNNEDRTTYLKKLINYYYDQLSNVLNQHKIDIGDILSREDFDVSYALESQFVCLEDTTNFLFNFTSLDKNKILEKQPENIHKSEVYSKKKLIEAISDITSLCEQYCL